MGNNNQNLAPDGGAHSDYLTINGFLEKAHTALINAQLPAIAPLLNARGYAAADLSAKVTAVAALRTLNEAQRAEYGEQYEATETYKQARSSIREDYMDHLGLARIAFRKDIGAKTALGLSGDRAQSQSGYAGQGLLFYNNALASTSYQAVLGSKGISAADLLAGKQAFENLQVLSAVQQKETGEAQQATKRRDAAYDELCEWMSDFYATAKIALRKHPQLMEQLGLKDAS